MDEEQEVTESTTPTTERVVLSIEDTKYAMDAVYWQGYATALRTVLLSFVVALIVMRIYGGTE